MNITNDRATKARAVLMRRAEEKKAALLRERGWVCIPPEDVEQQHRVDTEGERAAR
jgi:hypothetical protein